MGFSLSPFPYLAATRALLLGAGLLSTLGACGGSAGSKGPTASSKNDTPADSIGSAAAAQGGLPSLGGAGNREGDPPGAVNATFRADLLERTSPVKLDGVPGEWPGRIAASQAIRGTAGATPAGAALQYDDAKLYIAFEVTDPAFVRTTKFADNEDHASLIVAFPSGGALVTYEVGFFAGDPGETPGEVRWMSGGHGEVPGAKIVEAPMNGGYSFEAVIPWAAFPEARTTRVGLRGAARYYDAAPGAGVRTILATGGGDAQTPRDLPWLPTEPEQSLIDGLLIPKQLGQNPRVELYADVVGDAMKERIAVYDRYFTVCGPTYRGGKEFFFRDLGAELLKLEARDVTGRGKDDLLVRRRFGAPTSTREWFEIWSFLKKDEPETTFAHEIEVVSGPKHVANAVHVAAREVEVSIEPAAGWDVQSYKEPVATDVEPILLPWGSVKSQSFRWDGAKFSKDKEVAQTPTATPGGAAGTAQQELRPAEPPTPQVKQAAAMPPGLLEQYKRDHNLAADAKPRFDLQVHVDGDARPERVALMGKELVVFGPGFRGGNQYATLTLQQFADAADIKDLSARDITGDGGADLIVRGVRHVSAGAPSADPVEVEVMFIYQVKSSQVTRIFAVETAREQGTKRVQGLVQFIPARAGGTFDIDVRPGVAKGWTEKTYPWQEEAAGGAVEPLLLPWGKQKALRYSWNGTQFKP